MRQVRVSLSERAGGAGHQMDQELQVLLWACSGYQALSCKPKPMGHTHLDGWDEGEVPDQDDPELCRHVLHN